MLAPVTRSPGAYRRRGELACSHTRAGPADLEEASASRASPARHNGGGHHEVLRLTAPADRSLLCPQAGLNTHWRHAYQRRARARARANAHTATGDVRRHLGASSMPASVFPADVGDARLTERRSPRLGYTATGRALPRQASPCGRPKPAEAQSRSDASMRTSVTPCAGAADPSTGTSLSPQ